MPDDVLEELAKAAKVEVDAFRVRKRESFLRAYAAWGLQGYAGLTHRAIGHMLCIGSGSAVARQVKKWRDEGAESKEGRRWMKNLALRLQDKPEIA
jgi:alkanesulfonate monooxygenase SsuD/methylene tetrahydromethanopterin reductase-like flavin-dependent oxidoreductase (luciferase family)